MTKINYSHHRLTNDSELLAYLNKMGDSEFWDYITRLHTKIYYMKPGDSFKIDDTVIEENRDLFIKVLCFFISEHPARYLFNKNYTVFKRLKEQPKFESLYEEAKA